MARHLLALRVSKLSPLLPPLPPPPPGRGAGAGRRAALLSGHSRGRCALLQLRHPPCPAVGAAVTSPRLARGGGGAGANLQHLPFLPLPSAQIKKTQKAANHPRAKRSAAGGGRSVRRLNSAGGAHNWARAGQGWDAGPGFGEQGLAALLAPLLRLLSLPPRPPLLPPMPQPLHPHSGGRSSERCQEAASQTRTGFEVPSPPPAPRPPPSASLPKQPWPLRRHRL